MRGDVNTCPKCGGLITPQLSRCRQCGTYLHGTSLEGWLFEHVLPERLRGSPGTGVILLLVFAYYAFMSVAARTPLSFTSYSLQQLGATFGPALWLGQSWRVVTANFVHHDLIHLAFNVSALMVLGPLVEQAFDKKKMLFIYVVTGAASMTISHFYYTVVKHLVPFGDDGTFVTSGGASGAVCGLLGACWYAAHTMGPPGRDVAMVMKRWALYTLLMGLALPVNNAAHIGGGLVGALMARLIPMGLTKTVAAQRVLSVLMFGALGVVAACFVMMVLNLRGYPAKLENDAYGNRLFFITVSPPHPWELSSQHLLTQACDEAVRSGTNDEEVLKTCELAVRAVPSNTATYRVLADLLDRAGHTDRAKKIRSVLPRVEAALMRRLRPASLSQ